MAARRRQPFTQQKIGASCLAMPAQRSWLGIGRFAQKLRGSQTAVLVCSLLALICGLAFCFHERQASDAHGSQGHSLPVKNTTTLRGLMVALQAAEHTATGPVRSLTASKAWLEAALTMHSALVADVAPAEIRFYIVSEVMRIALTHMPWNGLLADRTLLAKAAPPLLEYMSSDSVVQKCCLEVVCVFRQVTTLMILQELSLVEVAAQHLRSLEEASGSLGECYGMSWNLERLAAPLDEEYPLQYAGLIDMASENAFWHPSDLPLAAFLEQHSEDIVAELAPLCEPEAHEPGSANDHFGPEGVVQGLARGSWRSWTSLPLLQHGAWNSTACASVAPLTCSLLQDRLELRGALHAAAAPDTLVQHTFVSVYRLNAESHIHRHVGAQWRLNTHLGLVTPPGAHIRVWNETRTWQVGRALVFPDAAEHEVFHHGDRSRCVLNVVSWHPAVLQRRSNDAGFAAQFDYTGQDEQVS